MNNLPNDSNSNQVNQSESQNDNETTDTFMEEIGGENNANNHRIEDGDFDDEDGLDDEPVFLRPGEAVEVQIDENDDDVPMDNDDENEEHDGENDSKLINERVPDHSLVRLVTHTGPVYAVAAHWAVPSDTVTATTTSSSSSFLTILSGGGDDTAWRHQIQVPFSSAAPLTTTASTSQRLEHTHTDSVSCVALNLDCQLTADLTKTPRLAAVGAFDGSLVLYDPDTGTKLFTLDAGPSDIEWLSFHPTGIVLLAGSATDATVWMYHLPLRRCLQVLVGHETAVTAGSFSVDGKSIVTASADGTVRLWAPRTGVCKHVFTFSHGNSNHRSSASSQPRASLTCLGVGGGSDGLLVVAGSEDGQAHVCHIGTKKVVASLRHFDQPRPLVLNNTAVNSHNNEDDEEEALLRSVEAVAFAPMAVNPNWCATGGVDGSLKIFDLANNGQCRHVCRLPPSPVAQGESITAAEATSFGARSSGGGITRIQWHPSLPLVFASSTTGTITLWDARNGGLLQTLTGHIDTINDMTVRFSPDGSRAIIVSASDDHTVRVFTISVPDLLMSTRSNTLVSQER